MHVLCLCAWVYLDVSACMCVFVSCTVAFQQRSYFKTKDKTVYQIAFDFPSPLLQLSYQIHPRIQTPTQACFFLSWWGLSLDCLYWATDLSYPHRNFSGFYFSWRHYLVYYLTRHCLVSTMISSCYNPYEYIWFPQHRQNMTHTCIILYYIIGHHRSHGYFVKDE